MAHFVRLGKLDLLTLLYHPTTVGKVMTVIDRAFEIIEAGVDLGVFK